MAREINGLRVYVRESAADPPDESAQFYCRRADGPYYRWSYKEQSGRWHADRINLAGLTHQDLRLARWKVVPPELQKKIGEHYLE